MPRTSVRPAIRKRKNSRRKVTRFMDSIRAWQTTGCSKTWDLVRTIYLHTCLMDIHLCCNSNFRIKQNNQVNLASPRAISMTISSCRRWKEGEQQADLIRFSVAQTSICHRTTPQEKDKSTLSIRATCTRIHLQGKPRAFQIEIASKKKI